MLSKNFIVIMEVRNESQALIIIRRVINLILYSIIWIVNEKLSCNRNKIFTLDLIIL